MQLFTYQVPEELISTSIIGKRVWVPYRTSFAIGVVVKVHSDKPAFEVKSIKKVLDDQPILSAKLLELTEWIHKFYFCSWGEVIQAALPAGLNFVSNTQIRLSGQTEPELSNDELFVVDELKSDEKLTHQEAQKRWRNSKFLKIYNKLVKKGIIELWQEPTIKVNPKTEKWIDWSEDRNEEEVQNYLKDLVKLSKWQQSLKALLVFDLPVKYSELAVSEKFTNYTLSKLKSEDWIQYIEKEVTSRFEHLVFQPDNLKSLNSEQEKAFSSITDKIDANEFTNFLLHGITGSGKTEVYIHSLKKVLEQGKTGIVLVPEIALTPQTVSRFYQIFGDKIAVLHSRMSNSERLSEWKSIETGQKKVVIGPRSAVFAPVENLGIIILDEEHDASYKQIDPAPRYHAREVAIMRANAANALVIMGSATPSMQALNMVNQGKAEMLTLSHRHADSTLPEVTVIDLKEYKGAMRGSMSVALYNAVQESLSKNEQVILLYNRRGFANYMQCETCGHIPKSPESSVSLTYHKRSNMLMCHYSGYARKADTICEVCGSSHLLIQGSGTQKIEEELEEYFPEARILRFDKDATSKKGAHEDILSRFGRKEADILIGTQLVAKGLDFPDVTTVGVIDADTEQAFPSFNSSERLFQLLSQVAGRSGRGAKKGKVFIQTRQSENSAIQFARSHNFDGFSKEEINFRKELNYPPYSRIVQFIFKGKQEHKVKLSAQTVLNIVKQTLPKLEVLGPSEGVIGWLNGMYIWELSIKLPTDKGANYIEKVLELMMSQYDKSIPFSSSSVRVNINVDAQR